MERQSESNWLIKVGDNRWRTTAAISFETRFGEVIVPEGFEFDKFSCVPNTPYPEFWKASLLHDYTRSRLKTNPLVNVNTKKKTDIIFLDEMLIQSSVIFNRLREEVGMKKAIKVYIKLIKLSFLYYQGVRGFFGTIYYWLDKVF